MVYDMKGIPVNFCFEEYQKILGRYVKKSNPMMRVCNNYEIAKAYTEGWNDAMDFVFNPVSNKVEK